MVSDKDAHSTDALSHPHCYDKFTQDCKATEINRDTVQRELRIKKAFNTTKQASDKSQILLSSTGFAD